MEERYPIEIFWSDAIEAWIGAAERASNPVPDPTTPPLCDESVSLRSAA